MVEPSQKLHSKHNCFAGAGVCQATPGKESRSLIANFGSKPVYLKKRQTVATAAEQLFYLMESDITHDEIIGVMETNNVYCKRNTSKRDIDVINKYLADAREAAVNNADETIDFLQHQTWR